MPPTYNSLIYERLFTNCELWKRSHKQLPSETDIVIPDEDGWYRISDDTDLKRDIRWHWYETWYQVTLICNVISDDTDTKRDIRWHWYEMWYQCDIDSQNQWYTLNWSGVLTRMWKRNKLITAMEALISYWYQQRNQWHTLNQRKSIWKIVIPNQWYQPIEEGNYRNLLLKAIEGAYRRGQL